MHRTSIGARLPWRAFYHVSSVDVRPRACHGPGMKHGAASEQAQQGKRIAREGWNGKGMFVFYVPPVDLAPEQVDERMRQFVPDGPVHVDGYFAMWTAQGTLQPGWLASQADQLADDWIVL